MERRVPAEVALDGQSERGKGAEESPSGAEEPRGEEDPEGYELRLALVQAPEVAEPIGAEGEEEARDAAAGPGDAVEPGKAVDEVRRGNEREYDQRVVGG